MAGESLLIADDQPVRLRLTETYLRNEGYKVATAGNPDEAAAALKSRAAALLFANLESAEGAGLELIRRLKRQPEYRNLAIIAAVRIGEEKTAMEAGSNAVLARPVGMASLGTRIKEVLEGRAPVLTSQSNGAGHLDLDGLRARFLSEGSEKTQSILERFDALDIKQAAKAAHQWIGTGGLLGLNAIARLARQAEDILSEYPLDVAPLRETFEALLAAFTSPEFTIEQDLPETIVAALRGKHVVAVEFTPFQQERLSAALDRVRAHAVFLTVEHSPFCEAALAAGLVMINVTPETAESPWLDPGGPLSGAAPVVLAGTREALTALPNDAQALARGFLMDSWMPDEALVRLSLAAAQPANSNGKRSLAPAGRPQVLVADDDPAALAIVRTTLENFGMECHAAENGADAIAAIRKLRPQAAVLDVNMPGMDGYEVLAAVRRQDLPIRVVLLTARQQESDVLRGFALGADDYVVKPFSPMELVARLKRLNSR